MAGMEGLLAHSRLTAITCFAFCAFALSAKALQPELVRARTKTNLSVCGSRPSIKKDPFRSLKSGMEGLLAHSRLTAIPSFDFVIPSLNKTFQPLLVRARTKTNLTVCGSRPSIKKDPFRPLKSGMEGLEPPKCLDQNQVPYHLATSQCYTSILIAIKLFVKTLFLFCKIMPK